MLCFNVRLTSPGCYFCTASYIILLRKCATWGEVPPSPLNLLMNNNDNRRRRRERERERERNIV
jgi:hypothetical protein